jgi:mono/diheme cytochrome c family protein
MTRRILATALALVGATALSAYAFGGWAVVTLDELPTHLTVGQPTTFSFVVRQHGIELMNNVRPSIDAKMGSMIGGSSVTVQATKMKEPGRYSAALTVPKSGEWRITINSGWGNSTTKLYPIQALEAGKTVASISEAERGRQLFAAKGCLTCHVNDRAGEKGVASDYGPNLTDKAYDPAYLAMWLANPKIRPPTKPGAEMPNFGLSKAEITSLVTFINNGKTAAAKQH